MWTMIVKLSYMHHYYSKLGFIVQKKVERNFKFYLHSLPRQTVVQRLVDTSQENFQIDPLLQSSSKIVRKPNSTQFTVSYHSSNTTPRVWWNVLGRPCASLWSLHRRSTLIPWESDKIEFTNAPLKVRHLTPTSSKIPCSSRVSKNMCKNSHISLISVFL